MFGRLDDPHLLVCETCMYHRDAVSEVVGPQLKHLDSEQRQVRTEQRAFRPTASGVCSRSVNRQLEVAVRVSGLIRCLLRSFVRRCGAAQRSRHEPNLSIRPSILADGLKI